MRVGSLVAVKNNKEITGRVLEIDEYDIVTIKVAGTGERKEYPIYQLKEIE